MKPKYILLFLFFSLVYSVYAETKPTFIFLTIKEKKNVASPTVTVSKEPVNYPTDVATLTASLTVDVGGNQQ